MWNYRVIKVSKHNFELREVYYNHDGSIFATTKVGAAAFGETKKELKRDLRAMLMALDKPVLKSGKIKFVPHSAEEHQTKRRKKHGS